MEDRHIVRAMLHLKVLVVAQVEICESRQITEIISVQVVCCGCDVPECGCPVSDPTWAEALAAVLIARRVEQSCN